MFSEKYRPVPTPPPQLMESYSEMSKLRARAGGNIKAASDEVQAEYRKLLSDAERLERRLGQ